MWRLAIILVGGCWGSSGPPEPATPPPAPAEKVDVVDKRPFDESTLTPDAVLDEIQSTYMAGIKRCYKNHLKQDATARGKVTLSFTVIPSGAIKEGKATGFANAIDACVSGQMAAWRFPKPLDKDGEATEASFAITLQLVPD